MSNLLDGVVGKDGVQPIYQPEARWCYWGLHELWDGSVGAGRYVPKVNDYVVEYTTFTTYIVESLDAITLIPELRRINPANMSFSLSETDVLFGVGPGTQSDTYRCYCDMSVTPYLLAIDARLYIGGSMCSYAKLFRGSDLSGTGEVISRIYNNSGELVSDKVPLELVSINSHQNVSIKTVAACNTLSSLTDGEIITAVFYSDNGHVVSKRQLLCELTSFIRSPNSSTKYVSHISLESVFLSEVDDHVIDFPLNVPISGLNLMGVVHYSDGSKLRLPVNGNKFTMLGLEQTLSTIIGQKVPLALRYELGNSEFTYGAVAGEGKYITENYDFIVSEANYGYTVKLFGFPVWNGSAVGYTMKFYLLNLDRNTCIDVTNHVEFADNTGPFNPKGYGYLQRKAVELNLRDVDASFKPFVHTQLMDIYLHREPDNRLTPWEVTQEASSSAPSFGKDLFAMIQLPSYRVINLANGKTTLTDWLDAFYYANQPLRDLSYETKAPTPLFFEVRYGTYRQTFSIDDWDKDLTLSEDISLYSSITIRFFRPAINDDITLGTASVIATI